MSHLTPDEFGQLAEIAVRLLIFLVGLWLTLASSGVIGRTLKWIEWRQRHGRSTKVIGALMMVFSLFLGVIEYAEFRKGPPFDTVWVRHSHPDGICSAEFPAAPYEKTVKDPEGKPVLVFGVNLKESALGYWIECSSLPDGFGAFDRDEWFGSVGSFLGGLYAERLNCSVQRVAERDIKATSFSGREIELKTGIGITIRTRAFYENRQTYQVRLIAPTRLAHTSNSNRFLDSFQITPK